MYKPSTSRFTVLVSIAFYLVLFTVGTGTSNAARTESIGPAPLAPLAAPTATDDGYELYGAELDVAAPGVLGNDSDPESDPMTAVLVDDTSNGTLTLNSDGSFTYTPGALFDGTDSFTYIANDGVDDSTEATVTITDMLMVRNLNDSGDGSLRWAMTNAGGHTGPDTVRFGVVGTIIVASQLPSIDDTSGPTMIDGTTAPGYTGVPVVVLDGPSRGTDGIRITSDGNVVRALQIVDFNTGIVIAGGTGNKVTRCYIGTDGTAALPNTNGIYVAYASQPVIGTNGDGQDDAIEGNVISGNTTGIYFYRGTAYGIVAGNLMGTDASGTIAVPNTGNCMFLNRDDGYHRIGTDGDGVSDVLERNICSASGAAGIRAEESGYPGHLTIAGNYIGTDITGSVALGNGEQGIKLVSGAGHVVGTNGDGNGHDAVEGNLVSANGAAGIELVAPVDSVVAGNTVGLDASGTVAMGNAWKGIYSWYTRSGNYYGTNGDGVADELERNTVSGNTEDGITLNAYGTNEVVAGNFVGTDVTGALAIPNGGTGIAVGESSQIRIGVAPGAAASVAERNVVSGNLGHGIYVGWCPETIIAGNLVGVDASGTVALGNGQHGIELAESPGSQIGTNADGIGDDLERNMICNSAWSGVNVHDYSAVGSPTNVSGNAIGTDWTGDAVFGNSQYGVLLGSKTKNAHIGGTIGNTIAHNGLSGVALAYGARGNTISKNSIYENSDLGIRLSDHTGAAPNDDGDLDTGANNVQNFPVIDYAYFDGTQTTVAGTYNSHANMDVVIEVFSDPTGDPSGHGEGRTFLAQTQVTTDSAGDATWSVTVDGDHAQYAVSSTATASDGSTSEFSAHQPANASPVAVDDSYSVAEDGQLVVDAPGVLANDLDVEGESLTAARVWGPTRGSLSFAADGSFTYTPNANYYGADLFTYRANDGTSDSNDAAVSITVEEVNDAPSAQADDYEMYGDVLSISAPGVLTNDSDEEGAPITARLVADASFGSVVLQSNGAFQFTPSEGFPGVDSFTYVANDGTSDSTETSVTIMDMLMVRNLDRSGDGSLWWAVDNANEHVGPDRIRFAVAGSIEFPSGSFIRPLMDQTGGTTIDGTTAPGFEDAPVVAISGPGNGSGITILTSGNIVRSLQITGFSGAGVSIESSNAVGNAVEGCYIGTDGSQALPNFYGIHVNYASQSRIGTDGDGVDDLIERNVISGNTAEGIVFYNDTGASTVAGNYIGVDATGQHALGNGKYGINVLSGTHGFGTDGNGVADEHEGNVISGNGWDGIRLNTPNNVIAGNHIGTSASGTEAIPNRTGIVANRDNNRIGTNGDGQSDTLERNVISGNTQVGVEIVGGAGAVIAGNYLGTDASGTIAVPNGWYGALVRGGYATVGTDGDGNGFDANERNLISGNGYTGLKVEGSAETVIAGNLVGTDVTGSADLGNAVRGIDANVAGTRIGTDGDGIADDLEGNVVSGNGRAGIAVGGEGSVVAGNLVGTDITGAQPLGNDYEGIITGSALIGSDGDGVADEVERNVIAANGSTGVRSLGWSQISGNYIGLDVTGVEAMGNAGDGVLLYSGSDGTVGGDTPAFANVIAYNGGDGVALQSGGYVPINNVIRLNSIYENGGLGIDLGIDGITVNDPTDTDTGPNNLLNYPLIDSVAFDGSESTLTGRLDTIANETLTVDVYANALPDPSGYGEGQEYIGSVVAATDELGSAEWSFVASGDLTSTKLSATATDAAGNTSEFSPLSNKAPVALDDVFEVDEDSSLTATAPGVLSNDSDPDHDSIRAELETDVSSGTLVLNSDGSFSYTPAPDFFGTDSFTYRAFDLLAGSNVATVDINVTQVQDAPVALDDSYEAYGDSLVVDAPGVLANDDDVDDEALSAVLIDAPTGGDLTLSPDGSFTYSPGPGFTGIDSFTYVADDGTEQSTAATVSLTHMVTVRNLNDEGDGSLRWAMTNANSHSGHDRIRFAVAGTIEVLTPLPELGAGSGGATLDGASAPGYVSAPVVILRGPGTDSEADGIWIRTAGNTVRGVQISSFRTGIEVRIATATDVVIEGCYIGTNGDAAHPNATGIYIVGTSDVLVGSDGDGQQDASERNVISGNIDYGVRVQSSQRVVIAGNYIGTDATGTTTIPNWIGVYVHGEDILIGTDSDGIGDTAERNVISGNGHYGIRSTATDLHVAGNFIGTDPSGTVAVPNVTGVSLDSGQRAIVGTNGDGIRDLEERNVLSGNLAYGVENLNVHGFTVAGNYIGTDVSGANLLANGSRAIMCYGASTIGTNGDGISDALEGNVIAGGGIETGFSDSVVAGNLVGTDATGTVLLGSDRLRISGDRNRIGTNSDGVSDELERNVFAGSTGNCIYLQNFSSSNVIAGNYIGTDITGTRDFGCAENGIDLVYLSEDNLVGGDGPHAGNVIAHNGVSGIQHTGSRGGNSFVGNSIHDNGSVGIDLGNSGVTPNDPGDLDIGPNGYQNFPDLYAAAFDGAETTVLGEIHSTPDTTFRIDLYGNTIADPSGHGEGEQYLATTTASTDSSGVGLVTLTVQGDVTHLALSGTATDPGGTTSEFSAIVPPNVAPEAVDDAHSVDEDTPLAVAAPGLLANDWDWNEDALTAELVAQAREGMVTVESDGAFTYEPQTPDWHGTDKFTYRAFDGEAYSEAAEVTITVHPINDAPVAVDDHYRLYEYSHSANIYYGALANDIDPESGGIFLTAELVVAPLEGTLDFHNDGSFTYVAPPGFSGTTTFAYTVTDGEYLSNEATVTLTHQTIVRHLNDSGEGSLRWAIANTEHQPGSHTIEFRTAGTIHVQSALPPLANTIAIDGASAPGYVGEPVIALQGPGTGGFDGLHVHYDAVRIHGLQIGGFAAGISGQSVSADESAGIIITGCWIGTDGVVPIPNTDAGVRLNDGVGHRIGTDGDGVNDHVEGNVISGNGDSGIYINGDYATVAGNLIGVDKTGTASMGNGFHGVHVWGVAAQIGTDGNGVSDDIEPNVISNNQGSGIYLDGRWHVVAGNLIGTDISGAVGMGNSGHGTLFPGGIGGRYDDTRIGTNGDEVADAAERNVIVAAGLYGIRLTGQRNVIAGNLIGTDVSGAVALGSATSGIRADGEDNLIGTNGDGIADELERNVISGSVYNGISVVDGTGLVVAGNHIGTDVTGTAPIPNGRTGVSVWTLATGVRVGTNGDGVADDAERNVISANGWYGVRVYNATGVVVAGNFIGTDASGAAPLGNELDGVNSNADTVVGTDGDGVADLAEANVISANGGNGVTLHASGAVAGNIIGMDVSGTEPLGNGGHGIYIWGAIAEDPGDPDLNPESMDSSQARSASSTNEASSSPVPVRGNTIAHNEGAGVALEVLDFDPRQNSIQRNYIHTNGGLGIDILGDGVSANDWLDEDSGANDMQNFPVIDSAEFDGVSTLIEGTLQSAPESSYVVDLYTSLEPDPSGYGEGETHVGVAACDTDTNGNCAWRLLVSADVSELAISATATDSAGNTSEFSRCHLPNTEPVAANDTFESDEDAILEVAAPGVLSNDSDPDNDALGAELLVDVDHGVLTLSDDGAFTYEADTDWHGTDTFTYVANDGTVDSNVATVTITVLPVNDAPVAVNDVTETDEEAAVSIDVLTNDTDVESDQLTVSSVTEPGHGTAAIEAGNTISYSPDADWFGTDTFTYFASDGTDDSNAATVSVTVNPVNDAPVAVDDAVETDEDTSVTIAVLANDVDPDPNDLTVTSSTQPSHGTAVIEADNTITYSPEANWFGTDTFTYIANDGTVDSNAATVTVTLHPVNDAPVAVDDSAETIEGIAVDISVLDNDTDIELDLLSVVSLTQPGHGSAVVQSGGSILYSADADWYGTDNFTYVASDSVADSNSATVTVTVEQAPDNAPILSAIECTQEPVLVDTAVEASATFEDADAGDTHTAIWDWGDGTTADAAGTVDPDDGTVTGSHAYDDPGVYTVSLHLEDESGLYDQAVFEYVVVYDPDGGYVTGGGWIQSAAGACLLDDVCAGATGKANFGFVSKYKKGASVPTGSTEFNFKAGGLNFHSSSYQWLVVNQNDSNAQYKGSGTINGLGSYKFMLWATDGDGRDPVEDDTFRIKIWFEEGDDETVVYDNGFDQSIAGGNIKVHKGD